MRIRTKILLATVGTSLVFAAFGMGWGVRQGLAALQREQARRELAVTRATAAVLREAVITDDEVAADDALDGALATEDGLVYAYVLGQDGRPLADTFSGDVPAGLLTLNPASGGATWTTAQVSTERGTVEDSAYRLFAYGPAELHIGFDREVVEAESASAILRAAVVLLAAIVALTAVVYLLERHIVSPLERLTEAVRDVDFTQPFTPVDIDSGDEVGVLARALNETGLRIQAQFAALREARRASRALARKVMQAQEEERSRVANDVHDSLMAQMASLRYWLESLKDPSALAAPDGRARLGEFKTLLDAAIGSGRQLITDLRPPLLDILGPEAALRDHVTSACERQGVVCTFEADELPEMDEESQVGLFRVVQEALANALRHSRPSVVRVTLAVRQCRLVVTVQDDGSGFDPSAAGSADDGPAGHLGLAAMRERAEILGGTLVLDSSPGAGTTVTVDLPLGTT